MMRFDVRLAFINLRLDLIGPGTIGSSGFPLRGPGQVIAIGLTTRDFGQVGPRWSGRVFAVGQTGNHAYQNRGSQHATMVEVTPAREGLFTALLGGRIVRRNPDGYRMPFDVFHQ